MRECNSEGRSVKTEKVIKNQRKDEGEGKNKEFIPKSKKKL